MRGLDEFLSLYGGITVLQIVETVLAIIFCTFVYRKIKDYLVTKHEAEKEKNEQLKEALNATRQYPKYREQSIKIQKLLEDEIQELRLMHEETHRELMEMKKQNDKRERNKLRDMLLQSYRYYTNKETNPSQSWTQMEAEAFWELFADYEEAGGNGFMHTVVQPAMESLFVVAITH